MDYFKNVIFPCLEEKYAVIVDEYETKDDVVVLRACIENPEDFVKHYGEISATNWIVYRNLKSPEKCAYRKKWVCHHNSRNKANSSERNLKCGCFIDIKIKHVTVNTKKRDPFLKLQPPLTAVITICLNHTHPVLIADALRMLRVNEEVQQTFFEYFSDGMSPSEAMQFHETSLLANNDTYIVLADASKNPCARQVYYLHQKWRIDNLGPIIDPFDKLQEKISLYTESDASVHLAREMPWSIVIVTAVMKRVQQLSCAKEIIFIDTTASCENSGSSLTVMLAATQVGALPIAILIHQSQTTESYERAFRILQETFPLCFGGAEAPSIFMTDDSVAEKKALQTIWPQTTQLLCHFHVAQAEWRYIWGSNIAKEDKPKLMKCFQKVMYATNESDLKTATEDLLSKEITYPEFVKRFRHFFQRKEEWVLLYRKSQITRNNNTNNFAEATMRILKDVVLNRIKAFNVVALTDFCVSTWDTYLKRKLLDYAYSRNKKSQLFYKSLMRSTVTDLAVDQIKENCFTVQSETDSSKHYIVDTVTGCCTCPAGVSGAFCKHQMCIREKHRICFPNAPPITQKDRYILGTLALGDQCPTAEFFTGASEIVGSESEAHEITVIETEQNVASISRELPSETVTDEDKRELAKEIERWDKLSKNKIPRSHFLHLLKAMKKVTTEKGVIRAVRTATLAISSSSRSTGRKIKVQPTSIARRRVGVTRGHSRVPSGRPAAVGGHKVTKRRRNLIENIRKNRPNAKSHGSGH